MAKSNGGTPSATYGWLVTIDTLGRVEGFVASAVGGWGSPATFAFSSNLSILDTVTWHHIAVIFDRSANSGCRLYIDGFDVTSNQVGDITGVGSLVNMADLRIGSEADGECQWRGSIDECIVSYTLRSPEWIKLCSMNQGSDDKLLEFR